MKIIDDIFSLVWDIADWFYMAYVEVNGWIWPFNLLAEPLYWIYLAFWKLLTPIANFGEWADGVIEKIKDILSWDAIVKLILSWIPNLEAIRDWFYNVLKNILSIVNDWWKAIANIVQGWIDIAKEALQTLIDNLTTWLTKLQAAWDSFKDKIPSIDEMLSWFANWWARILVQLTTWWNERLKEVNILINDTLKVWFPFYDELALFFKDPQQYVYNKLDEFFERFW